MNQEQLIAKAKTYLVKRDKVFITSDGHVFYAEHLGFAQSHSNTHKVDLFQVNSKGARRYGDKEHQADVELAINPPEIIGESDKPEKATTAIITIDGEETEMSIEEIRARLKELKVKFRSNTGLKKLAVILNDALND